MLSNRLFLFQVLGCAQSSPLAPTEQHYFLLEFNRHCIPTSGVGDVLQSPGEVKHCLEGTQARKHFTDHWCLLQILHRGLRFVVSLGVPVMFDGDLGVGIAAFFASQVNVADEGISGNPRWSQQQGPGNVRYPPAP
jgi:hypothetical protein